MFATIKRMIAPGSGKGDEGQVLSNWAKAGGHAYKTVRDKDGGGHVVQVEDQDWRVEWGTSQRSYIHGKELRFRSETKLSPDVQILLVSRVLAHTLETEVFSSFTNAMQTQVDNTLPDEMRWLPMHPRVTLTEPAVLAKRFVVLSNAETVARRWLDDDLLSVLEEAATTWWTDTLTLVMTVNRGRLTIRMPGQPLEESQLDAVGRLCSQATRSLRAAALSSSSG
ncbi:hypothetical protein [Aquabacterium sp.]|uniref:hypothetical protein n=1 Tax=Aquabacterium sp. TaxID=1872578 RepID=UPI003D6D3956